MEDVWFRLGQVFLWLGGFIMGYSVRGLIE